ncbi:MAG: alpha/beta hydrolase, partial [Anaerolineae bacterium]|nr:alpha/beta hydrolase [Anaerolineae bacterium]
QTTNVADYGDAVIEAIRQTGPHHVIVAHSFGALATLLALAEDPGLQPAKMVALAPMTHIDQHIHLFNHLMNTSPEVDRRFRQQIATCVGRSLERCSAERAVASLTLPALVIHDMDDQIIPFAAGKRLASGWRQATFIATETLGHRRLLTHPEVAEAIVTFIKQERIHLEMPSAQPSPLIVNGTRSQSA